MIKRGGEVILVDCGWNTDKAYEALEEGMREHGSHPSEITKLFVTHIHPDHYGMAGRLKQLSSCEVIIHQKDAEHLQLRYFAPRSLADQMGAFMAMNGVPPMDNPTMQMGSMNMLDKVSPVPPDTSVHGGEVLKAGDFEFEIIHTPGHSPGHICLYEPNRKLLFTGDHILPTITPNVSIHAQTHGSPLGEYIHSLQKLIDLDVEHVLPAHEFDIRDLKKRIIEIEAHHDERLAEMLGAVDRGGSTAYEIADRVKWATGMMRDFAPHLQRSAVGETIAHLEYMFERGQLAKVMRNGVLYWLPL
jgi:glyoxylase-like metal-dependent hydrolase (beta-lactamase superfamily II)